MKRNCYCYEARINEWPPHTRDRPRNFLTHIAQVTFYLLFAHEHIFCVSRSSSFASWSEELIALLFARRHTANSKQGKNSYWPPHLCPLPPSLSTDAGCLDVWWRKRDEQREKTIKRSLFHQPPTSSKQQNSLNFGSKNFNKNLFVYQSSLK